MKKLAWRHLFPIISLWEIFRSSRAANSVVSSSIWPKFELVQDFMHVLITKCIKRIGSKATEKRWRHRSPHYKSMAVFCRHGHQFWSNLSQNILQPFPTPSDATYKIWPRLETGLRDIQVWKCKISVIQRQVTPKWVIWSSPKSNSSELLCLSCLIDNFDDD